MANFGWGVSGGGDNMKGIHARKIVCDFFCLLSIFSLIPIYGKILNKSAQPIDDHFHFIVLQSLTHQSPQPIIQLRFFVLTLFCCALDHFLLFSGRVFFFVCALNRIRNGDIKTRAEKRKKCLKKKYVFYPYNIW